jgi:hypothetical protein
MHKSTISCDMSFCLSVCLYVQNINCDYKKFHTIFIFGIFTKTCRENPRFVKFEVKIKILRMNTRLYW